ncbi:bZIP transcription factor [Hymenobacter psychrophilus]|uniref:Uncharacterized protein n=1 Tax=Hymenobacter psychrophilus TaxID=651662 RepID=A0A1H3M462_9BACT|nr:bZIP transcription factor [Hymenobacter psychrophilus]SDY71510.1 hypothetical protein SAMN04488069_11245 [Hymenobacter psychrophilus]
MLHRLTFAPFPDTAAATWFADLGDALEAAGITGLLLANLAVSETEVLPAVAVLPGQVVVLQPATKAPTTTAQEQQTALATWLSTWPELPLVLATAIAGLVVDQHPAATPTVPDGWPATTLEALPRQLRALPLTLPFSEAVLHTWAASLTDEEEETEDQPTGFWEQKARQVWNWLGAADVPADPPYGADAPPTTSPADTAAEQQRLEQLRQQLFAELEQQRLQMEARETVREQSIAQLRQQLAATPSAAAEVAALQARLAAETQEKNALAAAIASSRQEAKVRNRELEARMQQLGHQVAQLQSRSTSAPATAPAAATLLTTAPASSAQSARVRASGPIAPRPVAATPWQLQWPRVALVLVLLGGIGAGGWAVQHYARPVAGPTETSRPAREDRSDIGDENLEAAAPTLFDIQPDTIQVDSEQLDSAREVAPEPATPAPAAEVMDSVVAPAEGI